MEATYKPNIRHLKINFVTWKIVPTPVLNKDGTETAYVFRNAEKYAKIIGTPEENNATVSNYAYDEYLAAVEGSKDGEIYFIVD